MNICKPFLCPILSGLLGGTVLLSVGGIPAQAGDSPPGTPADLSADTGPVLESGADSEEERDQLFDDIATLTEALLLIKKNYVREKTYREIVYGAIDGMLRDLDPYSGFLEPRDYEVLQEETRGSFSGIGIQVGLRGGKLTVIAPIEDSPAFHAGLRAADRITAIEKERIAEWSLDQIVDALRGRPGTAVSITIQRDEEDSFDVTLEREEIKLKSIRSAGMLDDRIGYIRLSQFSESTADDFMQALDSLQKRTLRALVLDLRDNPGGLLGSAVSVAGAFLSPGAAVVTTRGRDGERDLQVVRAEGTECAATLIPLAVLINGGSASGSEIVAGALRDNHRAVLVGQRSFGKASVQNVVQLQSNPDCAVRLTTSYYYTPGGRLIHEKGLEPDVAVAMKPSDWRQVQLRRAQMENWLDAYPGALKDPPLDRAVELLRGALIFQGDSE